MSPDLSVGDSRSNGGSSPRAGLAAVSLAAFAIGCCAALPLVAAFAGSIALGTVLGVGAGVVALTVMVALLVLRARRRAACEMGNRIAVEAVKAPPDPARPDRV